MVKVKDAVEFGRLLKALAQDVVDANIHFRLYKELRDSLYQHRLVYIQSRTFWSLTLEAHLQTSLHHLCRAFDQNQTALHLKSWLQTIKGNLHLFDEAEFRVRLAGNPFVDSLADEPRRPDEAQLDRDIADCSCRDPLVKTLTIHRGSQIAHRNARNIVAKRDVGDDHPLTYEGVETLLDRSKTILNRYSKLFAASTYSTQMIGHDDFKFIMSCIEETVMERRSAAKQEEARLQSRRQRD